MLGGGGARMKLGGAHPPENPPVIRSILIKNRKIIFHAVESCSVRRRRRVLRRRVPTPILPFLLDVSAYGDLDIHCQTR